jgi:hypothetical protein
MAIEWLDQPATDSRARKLDFANGKLIDQFARCLTKSWDKAAGRFG